MVTTILLRLTTLKKIIIGQGIFESLILIDTLYMSYGIEDPKSVFIRLFDILQTLPRTLIFIPKD